MRKIIKMFLVGISCSLVMCNILPLYAETSITQQQTHEPNIEENYEDSNNQEDIKIWRVYNSQGTLIGETQNPDEFMFKMQSDFTSIQPHSGKPIGRLVLAFIWGSLQTISTVEWVVDKVVGTYNWVDANIRFAPDLNGTYPVVIYSNDGNIYNPYPPNSYQGWYWTQNNFYYVIGIQ
ncbi:MAG: hypothetical protein RR623_10150 [Bacilli bacterium]|uniref:hypothetical protein n=1 Tax=Anaerorhabdus sp. TaxID=1872524 RepID=UPI002FC675F6